MLKDFDGKVCIITGAARGIGEAIARMFHQRGAKLALIDMDGEGLKKLGAELSGSQIYIGDITSQDFVDNTIAQVAKSLGPVSVLVNNAGITKDNLIGNITNQDWDRVMEVNLKAPFMLGRAVFPMMKEKKYGKIVNMISASWLGNIGQGNYSASKAGLVGLTRTMAQEFARYNVNVNGVSPGLVDTPMIKSIPENVKEKLINARPLKRIGRPEEIAEAVAFLASDRAAYITGQILHVDGGKSV